MARFMDVHDGFVGVTKDQFDAAHAADVAIQDEHGVSFDHAWLDPVSGKVFCLATGPDIESVKRVHELAGHPATDTFELVHEV